jgi:hypothetical protein
MTVFNSYVSLPEGIQTCRKQSGTRLESWEENGGFFSLKDEGFVLKNPET